MFVNQLFAEAPFFLVLFMPVERNLTVCPATTPICTVNYSNDKPYFD